MEVFDYVCLIKFFRNLVFYVKSLFWYLGQQFLMQEIYDTFQYNETWVIDKPTFRSRSAVR